MSTPEQPEPASFTGEMVADIGAVAHHPDGRPVTAADLEPADDDTAEGGGGSR